MRVTTMCLRNLSRRKVRTSLCILGIALGVSFILGISAPTERYYNIIKEMNTFYSGQVVVISKGSFFIQAVPVGGMLQEIYLDKVMKIEGVKNVVPLLFIIGPSSHGGLSKLVPQNITVGVPMGNWSVLLGSVPISLDGQWPSNRLEAREMVIGISLSDKNNLDVNSTVIINEFQIRVVGVLDTPSVFLKNVVIMPLDTAQKVYGYNWFSMIVVEPEGNVTQSMLANKIETEISGVEALTEKERNRVIERIFNDVELWSIGVKTVIFSLSMVLVMTVAVMNVSERRKELATLNVIGAPRRSIIHIIATETSLIGLLGGLIGIPIGASIALFVVSYYTTIPLPWIFPGLVEIVPLSLVLETLASAVILSCIMGVLAALTIEERSLIEALRSEH